MKTPFVSISRKCIAMHCYALFYPLKKCWQSGKSVTVPHTDILDVPLEQKYQVSIEADQHNNKMRKIMNKVGE